MQTNIFVLNPLTFPRASSTAAICSRLRGLSTLLMSPCSTWFNIVVSRGWCNWASKTHTASLAAFDTRVTLASPNWGWTLAPPVELYSSTWKRFGVGRDELRSGVRTMSNDVLRWPTSKVSLPSCLGKSIPALAGQIIVGPTDSSLGSS